MDKEKAALVELLRELEVYSPEIPDSLVQDILLQQGFVCEDDRVRKLVALAARKFVTEIAEDAMQSAKLRMSADKRGKVIKEQPVILTNEDLAAALARRGVRSGIPEYYADKPSSGLANK